MINETPVEWGNPFGKWDRELHLAHPEFFRLLNPERIKRIHVVDKSKTYHLVATPNGKRFIAQDKLANAEALGLSVRSL